MLLINGETSLSVGNKKILRFWISNLSLKTRKWKIAEGVDLLPKKFHRAESMKCKSRKGEHRKLRCRCFSLINTVWFASWQTHFEDLQKYTLFNGKIPQSSSVEISFSEDQLMPLDVILITITTTNFVYFMSMWDFINRKLTYHSRKN